MGATFRPPPRPNLHEPARLPARAPSQPRETLRASAMLIGIVHPVALSSAADSPWMVEDVAQAKWPFVLRARVHGLRRRLFMLVSGCFTAMLRRAPAWVKPPPSPLRLSAFLLPTHPCRVRCAWVGKRPDGPRTRPQAPAAPVNATPACRPKNPSPRRRSGRGCASPTPCGSGFATPTRPRTGSSNSGHPGVRIGPVFTSRLRCKTHSRKCRRGG